MENEENRRIPKEMNSLISFIANLDPFNTSADEFLSILFREAMKLIPEADCGSAFVYEDGKVRFVDAVCHDINALKKLRIDEKEFKLPKNTVLVVKDTMDYHSEETKKKFAGAVKPMKESLVFDLEVNGKNVAGIGLDILEGSEKHFRKCSLRLMKLFKTIASNAFKTKVLQENIKQGNKKFQTLLESLPIAIAIIEKEFRFTYVNKIAEDLTGYSTQELLTMNFQNILHPDFKEPVSQRSVERLNGANPIDEYDVKIVTKDGKEKWIDLRSERITLSDHPVLLVSALDITNLKNTQKKIEELQKRYELALKSSHTSVFENNLKTGEIKITEEVFYQLGYGKREIPNNFEDLKKLIHPDDLKKVRTTLKKRAFRKNEKYHVEYRIRAKSGNWVWIFEDGQIIKWDEDGNPLKILGVERIIDERKRMEQQLRKYATYDDLTGVYNRRIAMTILEEKIKIASRKGEPLSVCFIDVNGLKRVNDTFGHQVGDDLLKNVAKFVKENVRESDVVCRMGGDEFLIIFPACTLENAELTWQNVKRSFNEFNRGEKAYKINVSHGCAQYSYESSTDDFIAMADKKMYLEKKEMKLNTKF